MLATRRVGIALAAGFVLAGCREPTEAMLDISTDAACERVTATGISAGLAPAVETKSFDTTSDQCASGQLGSIVLYPDEGKDSPFAFKVVTSLGAPVEGCVPPAYGPTCIVARRSMRYAPHHAFHVPIRMSQACAGVLCPSDQTCVDGTCTSATLPCTDPSMCEPGLGAVGPWAHSGGGPGTQLARALALADDGTVAVAGSFDNEIDIGGGPLAWKGGQDIFVATYSQAGIHRWSRSFGGSGRDEGISVSIDPHGDVLLLAGFEGHVDFGGGKLDNAGATDVALVKLTTAGILVWSVRMGGAGADEPGKVAGTPDGGAYVVGSFGSEATFGTTKLTSAGGSDAFLARFDRAGDLEWVQAIGGPGEDGADGVASDADGNAYVAGFVEAGATAGSSQPLDVVGNSDVLVASFDATGAVRWAKTFGAPARDLAIDVAVRGATVAVTGTIAGDVTIDGTTLSAGQGDGFVATLSLDGKLGWAKAFGDEGNDQGEVVFVGKHGEVALGGEIFGGDVFGSEPVSGMGVRNPFLTVLEPDGTPRWSRAFSASTYASVTGVAVTPEGDAYFAGWFADDLDFVPSPLESGGAEDFVFARVSPP